MESATRRAPNEVRKERKRKLANEGDAAEGSAPHAAAPGQAAAPQRGPRPKRPRTAVQAEAGAGKQRLVRTVALGNLTATCAASALSLARSLGQVRPPAEELAFLIPTIEAYGLPCAILASDGALCCVK